MHWQLRPDHDDRGSRSAAVIVCIYHSSTARDDAADTEEEPMGLVQGGLARERGARSLYIAVAFAGAMAALPHLSRAAEWKPAAQVEIVVPNAPGGGNDVVGRVLQKVWQERRLLVSPSNVVNKPGGGGNVTLSYLTQKTGDPHVMAVVSVTQQLNYIVGTSAQRHRDFTPLAVMIGDFIGFAVRADSPIVTGRDLLERLKKDPGALSVGVTAIGGNNHIAYVMAARSAGIDTRKLKTPVFQSSGESVTALLGGHIDVHVGSVGPLAKQLEAGRVRIVAVTSEQRLSGSFASIPTWKEQGIAGTFNTWRGLWAPRGLSAGHVAYWDEVLERVSREPLWRETLEANHWQSDYRNSRDSLRYLDALHTELRDVLKELGIAKRVD
jgi:putative tricarboxylic transport membrane protein